MDTEHWIEPALAERRARGLDRSLTVLPRAGGKFSLDGREYLNFSSNDYLDLAHDPRVLDRAAEYLRRFGAGSGASRLLTGTLECHAELEAALASFTSYPAALVFGSGWLANGGVLSAVLRRGDVVFADRLSHATILDGISLGRAKLYRFRHNDPGHLGDLMERAGRARPPGARFLVATESVFSMDGDLAPLREICDLAGRHGAMTLVDEAHALGIFGPSGAGLVCQQDLGGGVNACTATLSKALGSYGGLVACSAELRRLLINCARPLIYSTALPPANAGAALAALEILRGAPDLGPALLARADRLRRQLQAGGLNVMRSQSQIIPLLVGDNAAALRFSARLKENGILAPAIREPTVPAGTARIRLSLTLAHSDEDLKTAAATIADAARQEGLA
jgi:8-amino-7-oxononanoate synthase